MGYGNKRRLTYTTIKASPTRLARRRYTTKPIIAQIHAVPSPLAGRGRVGQTIVCVNALAQRIAIRSAPLGPQGCVREMRGTWGRNRREARVHYCST